MPSWISNFPPSFYGIDLLVTERKKRACLLKYLCPTKQPNHMWKLPPTYVLNMFSRGNCDTQRQLLGRYFFAASYQTFCSVLLSPSLLQCCPTGSKVCPTFNKIDDRIPVFPLIISRHFFTNNNAVKIYLSGQKLSLRHRHGFSTPFIQSYEDGGKKRAALGRKCSGKHCLARLTKCVFLFVRLGI